MTLGFRLAIQLLLLLGCLTLTAGVGLWSIRGTRQDFTVALSNYDKLRKVYQIGLLLQSSGRPLRESHQRLVVHLPTQTLQTVRFPKSDPFEEEARRDLLKAKLWYAEIAPSLDLEEAQRNDLTYAINNVQPGSPALVKIAMMKLGEVLPPLRQEIFQSQYQADQRKNETFWWMGIVAGVSLLASTVVGLFQWQAVMGPLAEITKGLKRIGGNKFDAKIQLSQADREFQEMATDFNQMSDHLKSVYDQLHHRVEGATRSLVQSERLAGVGMLAAGVAHEINNPLAIITGRIELLMTNKSIDDNMRNSLKIALDEAFRCKQIIDRLLSLSRGPSGKRDMSRLDDLVSSVVHNVRALPGAAGRKIDVVAADPISASIDQGEIKQVVLNLLINAIQATGENGKIAVSIKNDAMWGEIVVQDDGRGMDKATLDRLFEPFFSARPGESRGTGLGLAISKAIIEAHSGTLEADSAGPGRGSKFCVRLPLTNTSK